MQKALHKITDGLERVQIVVGCIMFVIFLVAVVIQVGSRIMKISLPWTTEVATYSFIWTVYNAAAVMFKRNEHFKFTIIEDKIKGQAHEIYDILINIVICIFCILTAYYGIQLVQRFWTYHWNTLPFMRNGYHWLCVPIMGGSMAIYAIEHIIDSVFNIQNKTYRVPVEEKGGE